MCKYFKPKFSHHKDSKIFLPKIKVCTYSTITLCSASLAVVTVLLNFIGLSIVFTTGAEWCIRHSAQQVHVAGASYKATNCGRKGKEKQPREETTAEDKATQEKEANQERGEEQKAMKDMSLNQ